MQSQQRCLSYRYGLPRARVNAEFTLGFDPSGDLKNVVDAGVLSLKGAAEPLTSSQLPFCIAVLSGSGLGVGNVADRTLRPGTQ
jgi:hypothetical protein